MIDWEPYPYPRRYLKAIFIRYAGYFLTFIWRTIKVIVVVAAIWFWYFYLIGS